MRGGVPFAALALLATLLAVWPALAAAIFTTEPALGRLRVGQRVLVDDGACKAGYVTEIVVNSRKAGDATRYPDGGPRVRRCVRR